jgi:adenosylmethionine-8-amino-7-oxononanoate aminotransferase
MRSAFERVGPERIAAVFAEPVIGAGGVHPPAPGYLEGLAELCAETGVLFIVDSVICGFGRLGTWYGIERWGIEPDMITFAKGVTSGYLPLGGVLISDQIAEPFWEQPGGPIFRHGPTYAGHATCCAAAVANIELLERDNLLARGRENEQALLDALSPFASLDVVGEVRGGIGTLSAVELAAEVLDREPRAVALAVAAAREAGVLIRPLARAVAVSPPLTADEEHFQLIAQAVERGLQAAAPAALR